jgi:hypothetical protein
MDPDSGSRIRDQVLPWIPGFGMEKIRIRDPGSGISISVIFPISKSLVKKLLVQNAYILFHFSVAYPDPEWKNPDPGSGILDKNRIRNTGIFCK